MREICTRNTALNSTSHGVRAKTKWLSRSHIQVSPLHHPPLYNFVLSWNIWNTWASLPPFPASRISQMITFIACLFKTTRFVLIINLPQKCSKRIRLAPWKSSVSHQEQTTQASLPVAMYLADEAVWGTRHQCTCTSLWITWIRVPESLREVHEQSVGNAFQRDSRVGTWHSLLHM